MQPCRRDKQLEVLRELARIAVDEGRARRARLGLPRVLRGKLEAVLVALELSTPIVELCRRIQRPLSARVVLVLDGQGRQSWPLCATERVVRALELSQKDGFQRPRVRRDVVHVQQEQVPVVRQLQQGSDEDRPATKVEAVLEMSLEVLQQASVVHRDDRQAHALRRCDELHGLAVYRLTVVGAQALVTAHDFAQALLQRRDVEAAFHEQHEGQVVARILRISEVVDPQPFLKPGQRAAFATWYRFPAENRAAFVVREPRMTPDVNIRTLINGHACSSQKADARMRQRFVNPLE